MAVITMKQLLEVGAHFGHQAKRWNPKMKPYIFTERNGIHILDLHQTLGATERAYEFVRQAASEGGQVLFVGTKKLKNKSDNHAPATPAELDTAKVSLLNLDQPGSSGE